MVQSPTTSWTAGESYAGIFNPPLVSLVLINWNYARYVGAAIDSIKSQDYPFLEAIVVDNGSTDASRDVIAKHVGEDERFRIVHLGDNIGQLGAFLDIFNLIRGEFVTVVDADDVLFSNFLSFHVQVHLALPRSVAMTSSNVVEMTADSRALTGGYATFGWGGEPISHGLRPPDAALRLSTISNVDYLQLARSTSTHLSSSGWIWGPGTANMYRRSILALVCQQPKDRTYLRAADSYLNRLCHVLGGSALIDRQLSAYRVHGVNYFAERESVHKLRNGRLEFAGARGLEESRELISLLFRRAKHFEEILSGRGFWHAVAHFLENLSEGKKRTILSDPRSLELFIHNYEILCEVFGETDLFANLRRILIPRDLRALMRAVKKTKKAVKNTKKIVAGKNPTARKQKKRHLAPEDSPVEFEPAAAVAKTVTAPRRKEQQRATEERQVERRSRSR